MTELSRRGLITGLIAFAVTAPAIVRAGSLMPVKVMIETPGVAWVTEYWGGFVYMVGPDGAWHKGRDGTWRRSLASETLFAVDNETSHLAPPHKGY